MSSIKTCFLFTIMLLPASPKYGLSSIPGDQFLNKQVYRLCPKSAHAPSPNFRIAEFSTLSFLRKQESSLSALGWQPQASPEISGRAWGWLGIVTRKKTCCITRIGIFYSYISRGCNKGSKQPKVLDIMMLDNVGKIYG